MKNSQGVINGMLTKLYGKPEKLKEFMSDKTEAQKIAGRSHLRTLKIIRGSNGRGNKPAKG